MRWRSAEQGLKTPISLLDFSATSALEWPRGLIESFPQQRTNANCPRSLPSKLHAGAVGGGMRAQRGGCKMTALIVGLVSIALIWVVVIYGSIYVNKNVQ